MSFKELIECGDTVKLSALLAKQPQLANQKIHWGKANSNETDPLHYVSDCVFNRLLINGAEAEIAALLITSGAMINGNEGAESPLIGAVSLSVESVAKLLIETGADISVTSVHGANALHWAAYVGLPDTVKLLLSKGANIEQKCMDFQASPLFWAVQGLHKSHLVDKSGMVDAAEILVQSGADVRAENFQGESVLSWAQKSGDQDLITVIEASLK